MLNKALIYEPLITCKLKYKLLQLIPILYSAVTEVKAANLFVFIFRHLAMCYICQHINKAALK